MHNIGCNAGHDIGHNVGRDMGRQNRYFDTMASSYDSLYRDHVSRAENFIVAGEIASLIFLARHEVRSVLDVGCGTGLMLDMADYFGCADARYVGVDRSRAMLQRFRQKYVERDRVQVLQGDMNTFDFQSLCTNPDEKFDLVLSTFGSFSYVKDPAKFLSDIRRVLRDQNGHVLVMPYSRFSVQNLLTRVQKNDPRSTDEDRPYLYRNDRRHRLDNAPYAHFHTKDSLLDAAHSAGLKRPAVQGLNFFLDSANTGLGSFDEALRALQSERREIPLPDLAHTLILTATNYE